MATIYACYISGTYQAFSPTEGEAQKWAAAHGEAFHGSVLQGQYAPLEVSSEVAAALLREQPCLGHTEAMAYA